MTLSPDLEPRPAPRRTGAPIAWIVTVALLLVAPSIRAADFLVDSTVDAVDIDPADDLCLANISPTTTGCTLRAAVQQANADPTADTITLPVGVFVLSLDPLDGDAGGDLDVREAVTIQGAGFRDTTIDANQIDRVFDVASFAVTIRDVTIRNGRAENSAGIDACCDLMLDRPIVEDPDGDDLRRIRRD